MNRGIAEPHRGRIASTTCCCSGSRTSYVSWANNVPMCRQRGNEASDAHSIHQPSRTGRRCKLSQSLVFCLTLLPVLHCPSSPVRRDVLYPTPPSCQIHPRLQHLRRHESGRLAFPCFQVGAAQWWGRPGSFATTLAAVCSLLVVSDKEHCCGPAIIRHRATWNINPQLNLGAGSGWPRGCSASCLSPPPFHSSDLNTLPKYS